jgi:hypothetical protein
VARFGHRTPVSHSRPAAPFSPRFVGGACGRCIIGRPFKNDAAAIQKIVMLLASDPKLSLRAAAAQVVGPGSDRSTHIERLRKKYRVLRGTGQLPLAAIPWEKRVDEIRELYRRDAEGKATAQVELAAAEQQAKDSGFDVSGLDRSQLMHMFNALEDAKNNLEGLITAPSRMAFSHLRSYGAEDADEAISRLSKAAEDHRLLEGKLELLRTIRALRFAVGR